MTAKVAILMATYNGEAFLAQQLQSILFQTHGNWHLFVRDDGSTDETVSIIRSFQAKYLNISLLDNLGRSTGSAAGNFFELIQECALPEFDYVALADQDDVWSPDKLEVAITLIKEEGAGAYSSNLVSYDNRLKRARFMNKGQAQKKFDYLFQGASAGCTYVLTRAAFEQVRQATSEIESYKGRSHDWLIYAICRVNRIRWVFDQNAHIFYRQHASNVYGAMSAFAGLKSKLGLIRNGWYRDNVIWIAEKSGADASAKDIVGLIKSGSFTSRLRLALQAADLRREKNACRLIVVLLLTFVF